MILTLSAALVVGLILLALARRWSEIPTPKPPPRPEPTPPPGRPAAAAGDERDEGDEGDEDETWEDDAVPDRILVDHPLIRRAALKAIEQSAGAARFFVIENDQLYFVPEALPDPAERARATAILLQVQVGSATDAADLAEILWLAQRITRG